MGSTTSGSAATNSIRNPDFPRKVETALAGSVGGMRGSSLGFTVASAAVARTQKLVLARQRMIEQRRRFIRHEDTKNLKFRRAFLVRNRNTSVWLVCGRHGAAPWKLIRWDESQPTVS